MPNDYDETDSSRVYHRFNAGDPLSPEDWSLPTEISAAKQTSARNGTIVATDDSVWVAYQCHDNPEAPTRWATWGHTGEALGSEVPSGQTQTWSGLVYLDRDFLVGQGETLVIEAGTHVIALPDTDLANVGRDSDKVELIVRGTLQVDGETTDRVQFKSVNGDSGAWGGILFDVPATLVEAEYTTYGYCNSYVYHADIKDAQKGIAIRQTGAPSLYGVAFANNFKHRDVALDSSDVYVPNGGTWSLIAPVNVKVAESTRTDAEIESLHPGNVDIVVQGTLSTDSPGSAWVRFEPDSIPPSGQTIAGDNWGGIYLDWMTGTNGLSHTDIGYAITPVSLVWQGATIEDCRIHHFKERAISMYSSRTTGPQILGCSVFRDTTGTATLNGLYGNDGIVIEDALDAEITGNRISLSGVSGTAIGAAILVDNTPGQYGICSASTSEQQVLSISDNTLIGPDWDSTAEGEWSGIKGYWMCGYGLHDVEVTENVILEWNGAGIDLDQSADIQVNCNRVQACKQALEFRRDSGPQGADVRFRQNALRVAANAVNNDQHVVLTDNTPKSPFGPSGSTLGLNNIIATGADWFVVENDENSSHTLNARDNYWYRNGSHYTGNSDITRYVTKDSWVTDPARVDPTSAENDSSTCAPAPQMARVRVVRSGEAAPENDVASGSPEERDLPARTGLALPGPIPSRGAVEVRFDLAGAERRRVSIEVFDVSGRRVKSLVDADLPGGQYGLTWDGGTDQSASVSAGVYFVRLRAGSVTEVRKAVLLR